LAIQAIPCADGITLIWMVFSQPSRIRFDAGVVQWQNISFPS
jgi:hypothetical protein